MDKKSELSDLLRQQASHLSLCHIYRPNLTLVTNLCRPQPVSPQDILISSVVIGLLSDRGRGFVSDMLSEHISVPLGLRLMFSDSNRPRLHFKLHRIFFYGLRQLWGSFNISFRLFLGCIFYVISIRNIIYDFIIAFLFNSDLWHICFLLLIWYSGYWQAFSLWFNLPITNQLIIWSIKYQKRPFPIL